MGYVADVKEVLKSALISNKLPSETVESLSLFYSIHY